jgi:hypothetical protein
MQIVIYILLVKRIINKFDSYLLVRIYNAIYLCSAKLINIQQYK